MKMLRYFLFLGFLNSGFAQADPNIYIEILTWATNFQHQETVVFTMQSVGQVWCKEAGAPSGYLTDDYQIATEIFQANNTGSHYGFNQCWHSQGWEEFGFGLYKITISDIYSEEWTHFYLDYRYCDEQVDCTILFDNARSIAGIRKGIGNYGNTEGFTDIPTGSVVKIWEVQGYSNPTTDCLPYFWENCLILLSSSNHPRFVWGPYPDDNFNTTHYRIYRRIELGNWSLCAVVNSNTFEYTDSEVSLSTKTDRVDYYVKAYNGSTESSATNTVTVIGQYNPNKETAGKNIEENIQEISLDCYPNPFNPTTVISY